jgi:hypothetical protein
MRFLCPLLSSLMNAQDRPETALGKRLTEQLVASNRATAQFTDGFSYLDEFVG